MTAASPGPRFNIHAFVLGWLCFVTLPALLAYALPERADGTPAFRTLSHVGKAVRPEIGLTAAPLPVDHRKENAGSNRPDPALLSTNAALPDIATGHLDTELIDAVTSHVSNPPYR